MSRPENIACLCLKNSTPQKQKILYRKQFYTRIKSLILQYQPNFTLTIEFLSALLQPNATIQLFQYCVILVKVLIKKQEVFCCHIYFDLSKPMPDPSRYFQDMKKRRSGDWSSLFLQRKSRLFLRAFQTLCRFPSPLFFSSLPYHSSSHHPTPTQYINYYV